MSNTSTHCRRGSDTVAMDQCRPTQYVFVNHQAATSKTSPSAKNSLSSHNNTGHNSKGSRPHPTMRLPQIQESCSSNVPPQSFKSEQACTQKSRQYHQAVSQDLKMKFDEQLAASFAAPLRLGNAAQQRPPSLAATHPANYNLQTKAHNVTQLPQPMQRISLSPNETVPSPASSSAIELHPYNDPMHQTSTEPHYWKANRTVLKRDVNIEDGNVISPTWMIGLPFGGMVEMADAYPVRDGDADGDES